MALDATRAGTAVAQALRDAGLLAGETDEERDTNQAAAAAIWTVITGALWQEMTAHAELRAAQAATGIPVHVDTGTGNGSTTAAGAVSGGIQ